MVTSGLTRASFAASGIVGGLVANGVLSGSMVAEIIERLGWLHGPILAVFYLTSIVAILYYRIDRETHAANFAMLKRTQTESIIP